MKVFNKFFKLQSRQAGFSLVELMTVVAIIGIMTSIGLVSLNASKTQKELQMEARKVAASIKLAQNNAIVGRMGPSGKSPCNFEWRNFFEVNDFGSYWIRTWYKNGSGVCGFAEFSDDTMLYLQNGVTFKDNSGSDIFYFSVPFSKFSDNSIGTQDNKVTIQKGSQCIDISIADNSNVVEGAVYGC